MNKGNKESFIEEQDPSEPLEATEEAVTVTIQEENPKPQRNKLAVMVRLAVKTVNAAYMCGFFTYYMLQHEWTVLQALTFQVHNSAACMQNL